MDSIDLEVLKCCAQWLAEGRRCELLTVVRTWGSSPRPPGAMLAMCDDGRMVGSVSGGCIEDDLIARLRENGLTRLLPELVRYGVSAEQAHRFGLPCGGTLELLIEPLSAASGIGDLLQALGRHELVARRLCLADGAVTLAPAVPGQQLQLTPEALCSVHGPRWRLLIIGAGQLSRFVAQIALSMDYQVIVCEPREEYRAAWHLDGVRLSSEMPDDAVLALRIDSRCAVLALTHDPRLDDLALIEALKSEAFYVGALGSRANNARRRERLALFDLGAEQLARLHGPVGLYIGSKTPAEIAVSILAEMTAVKNEVALPELAWGGSGRNAGENAGGASACAI